jgi:hypothetical protein
MAQIRLTNESVVAKIGAAVRMLGGGDWSHAGRTVMPVISAARPAGARGNKTQRDLRDNSPQYGKEILNVVNSVPNFLGTPTKSRHDMGI